MVPDNGFPMGTNEKARDDSSYRRDSSRPPKLFCSVGGENAQCDKNHARQRVQSRDVDREENEQTDGDDGARNALFFGRPDHPFEFGQRVVDEIFGAGGLARALLGAIDDARRARGTRGGSAALPDDRLGAVNGLVGFGAFARTRPAFPFSLVVVLTMAIRCLSHTQNTLGDAKSSAPEGAFNWSDSCFPHRAFSKEYLMLKHGRQGSNPRPTVLETAALPTELRPYEFLSTISLTFRAAIFDHTRGIWFWRPML